MMMINLSPVQRAWLAIALTSLSEDDNLRLSMPRIAKMAGVEVRDAIRDVYADLRSMNDSAKEAADILSADSEAYHRKVERAIQLGKRGQALDSKTLIKLAATASEKLVESFEELVPDNEKHYFTIHRGDDVAGEWDDRWEYLEFRPPLLRRDLLGLAVIANPLGTAQRQVIGGLLSPKLVMPPRNVQPGDPIALRGLVRRLLGDRLPVVPPAETVGEARRSAAAARRKELVARGDQAATKKARAQAMKPVSSIFAGPAADTADKPCGDAEG